MRQLVVMYIKLALCSALMFGKMYLMESRIGIRHMAWHDTQTQMVLTSVQIYVVFVAMLILKGCRFVLHTVYSSTRYAALNRLSEAGVGDSVPETVGLSKDGSGMASTFELPDTATEDDIIDDMSDICVDVVEGVSKPHLTFVTEDALHQYVISVHVFGCVLWGTVYCLDYAHTQAVLYFIVGLFVGWVFRAIFYSKNRGMHSRTAMAVHIANVFLMTLVMCLYISDQAPHTDYASIAIEYVLPVATGYVWTTVVSQGNALQHAYNSLVSTSFVCLLVLATSDPQVFASVWTGNTLVVAYTVGVEPILKYIVLHVFVISIHTGRRVETVVVFVCVYALCRMAHIPTSLWDFRDYTVAGCVSILLLIQSIRNCRADAVK